ncbi:MAG TPA: DUF2891 domain-containing protein [Gemmatimonadaceae bacterium]
MTSSFSLTAELASKFARLALSHVTRELPNKLDHVINDVAEIKSPRELHPVFYGSFDWHSCVHGYWLLATVHRLFPSLGEAEEIERLFDAQLAPAKIKVELDYLGQPMRGTFERPYGWAWLLMLAAELNRGDSGRRRWSNALQPLAEAFANRFKEFLPKATYPTRVGTHFNSAFAIALALDYAAEADDADLNELLRSTATRWFGNDADSQAWEPGGDDFLSSTLMEAECMRRALSAAEFSSWRDAFLPKVSAREPSTLFRPATVSDRSDGKIAHLDGLNLSRAWCWRSLAQTWGSTDNRRGIALEAAEVHLGASMPYVAGDYMGEHWLATFALLALL